MNLILFTEEELAAGLPLADARARHILDVLRRGPGEGFDIGMIDGPRGKARVRAIGEGRLTFDFELGDPPPALEPLTLLVGLSRPQTMRRILRDATSLGAARLGFFVSDRGERGYAESALWRSGEYRRHLIEGAQQAFSTRLPQVSLFPSLAACLSDPGSHSTLLAALDNYEAPTSLGAYLRRSVGPRRPIGEAERAAALLTIAVGSERGWSAEEREILRASGYSLVHLGTRVQRTEVACIGAVAISLSALGGEEGDEADA